MTAFTHDNRHLAEAYDRLSDHQVETGKRLVDRLGIVEGAHVLDVGCGTGRVTDWIAQRVGPSGGAIGIDPLHDRIQLARARGGSATFEVGEAEDLGAFAAASFDAVCMSSVFHWIADQPRALAEAHRVLRPGGYLGVTTPPLELSKATTVGRVLDSLLAREPYAGRIDRSMLTFVNRRRTTTELLCLLLESGFEVRELHITQSEHTYASGAAVVEFMEASSFGTLLGRIPGELRVSLRHDLAAALEGVAVRSWTSFVIATLPPDGAR